jgi:hypothetical protein
MACACGTAGWRVLAWLKQAATLPQQEKNSSSVVQRGRVNISSSVQKPLALAAINLSQEIWSLALSSRRR